VTSALEGGGWSAPRPDRRPRPQGRSGRVRKIAPLPGFDPRTVQSVASCYTDWTYPAHGDIKALHFMYFISALHGLDNLLLVPKNILCVFDYLYTYLSEIHLTMIYRHYRSAEKSLDTRWCCPYSQVIFAPPVITINVTVFSEKWTIKDVEGCDNDLISVWTQIFKSRAWEKAGTIAVIDAHTLQPLMDIMKSSCHRQCTPWTWNVLA
jgi:hypothetical protein